MARRFCMFAVALLLLAPAVASAVTIDDLIGLSKAGLADDILTALIDADRTVFQLTPDQIVQLKTAGVRDAVIVKMIGTPREFGADAGVPPRVVVIGADTAASHPASAEAELVYVPVAIGAWPYASVSRTVPHHSRRAVSRENPHAQPIIGAPHFVDHPLAGGGGFGRFINTIPPLTPLPVHGRR
jgi:hypothetical protein